MKISAKYSHSDEHVHILAGPDICATDLATWSVI